MCVCVYIAHSLSLSLSLSLSSLFLNCFLFPFNNNNKKKDLVRSINDPEHPLTLEELNVIQEGRIQVDEPKNSVRVQFTPTIPHCSMATLIGLSIRVRLLRSLPSRFKVDVEIFPGTHASADAVNKQLADKERVAAALENQHLLEVVNQCLAIKTA